LRALEARIMAKPQERALKVIALNRRARFNYEIGETFEAGIALTGSEVKSLRQGKATIAESYADPRAGEVWLVNANIPEYLQAGRFNHAPKRPRKLLLHRRQIHKLMGAVEREGMTLVPLRLYFNEKGRAKLELALARGKKLHDKRESERQRSWERERGRLLRAKG
jgi:SsrA-binding protein